VVRNAGNQSLDYETVIWYLNWHAELMYLDQDEIPKNSDRKRQSSRKLVAKILGQNQRLSHHAIT